MVVYLGKATPASGTGGGGSGDAVWGSITGTLSDQTDLQTALNAKANSADLATVATTGAYSDLSGTPTIPTTTDSVTQGSSAALTSGGAYTALSSKLENTATGTNSLSIGGTATSAGNATNIGATSNVTGNYSTALGYGAGVTSGATRAIQIGEGTNSTSNTLSIGFGANNYRLLDGSTGKIPNDRLRAFTGATSQASGTTGAVPAPTTSDVGKFLSADGTWATAGADIDESTITENAQNKLQAVGVVNQNAASGATNPLKLWEGTEAEYNIGGGVKDTYYDWKYSNESLTAGTFPSAHVQTNIATGNGVSILFGYDAKISTDDGETWSNINPGLVETGYIGVVGFGNNKFILYPGNSTTGAYTTDNGQTWHTMTIVNAGYELYGIAYGNGIWLVTSSSNIICSTDEGATWSDVTPSGESNFRGVAFGNGKFIVCSLTSGKAYITVDGTSFTTITLPYSNQYLYPAFGNGEFVLVSGGFMLGTCIHSVDLENWTAETHPYINFICGFIFGNGYFIMHPGNSGSQFYYTKDFKFWVTATPPSPINKINLIGATTNNIIIKSYYDGENYVYGSLDISSVYTLDENPTTSSQVYSAPAVTSALTITAVGTGTITLSDTNTYTYNSGGNAYSYYTVGENYPNYICLIEGVGVKIGSTLIAQVNGTVDQTYDATSTNAISGVGVADALTRPNT